MFTHIVFLNVEPYFLYAANEKDALQLCDKFYDSVIGVVEGKDLIVKHPERKMSLVQDNILQVEYDKNSLSKEKIGDTQENIQDDIENELNKIEAAKELEDELTEQEPKIDI